MSLDPACVQKLADSGYGAKHELFNIGLCVFIISYISRNTYLRNTCKFDLLPLMVAQFCESSLYAVYYAVPYSDCYTFNTRPSHLEVLIRVWFAISICKHFVIMHLLIRPFISSRYGLIGLISSIVFPLIIGVVPAMHYVLRFWMTIFWRRIAHLLVCICVACNTTIAVCLTKSGQTNGSFFPALMAVDAFMHTVSDITKHLLAFEFGKSGAYYLINNVDDYTFIVTGPLCIFGLIWEKRRSIRKSFENQNKIPAEFKA